MCALALLAVAPAALAVKPYSVAVNETNFPDTVFRAYVRQHFGNIIYNDEVMYNAAAKTFNFAGKGITNLKGIEYFWCLEYLDVSNNPKLTKIDWGSDSYTAEKSLRTIVANRTGLTELT